MHIPHLLYRHDSLDLEMIQLLTMVIYKPTLFGEKKSSYVEVLRMIGMYFYHWNRSFMIVFIIEHVEFISVCVTIELTGDCIFESIQHWIGQNSKTHSHNSYRLTIRLKFQPNASKHERGGWWAMIWTFSPWSSAYCNHCMNCRRMHRQIWLYFIFSHHANSPIRLDWVDQSS